MAKPTRSENSSQKQFHFSIEDQPLYPHIKLTREPYPRLLATRKIEDDDAEYFGPFLTRSTARILIDFLNKTFRLRTCFIDIDGDFEVPCIQYYSKRCLAPCVKSLCGQSEYLEAVELARLFLRNNRDWFGSEIQQLIKTAADALDFEKAAFLHDMLQKCEAFWQDKRRQVWLDDTVDTLAIEQIADEVKLYLVTTRGRRTLGSRVFVFPAFPGVEPQQALSDVIEQFYILHVPREIRVSHDFAFRGELSRKLAKKLGRTVKIVATGVNAASVTAVKALILAKLGADLESIKSRLSQQEIGRDLKKTFGLAKIPTRIEGFDAAHISGSDLVAAMSVWQNGKFLNKEYRYWLSDRASEIDTLRAFIAKRFTDHDKNLPGLILIDGGMSQLNAAIEAVDNIENRKLAIISAVKPKGRHSEISHFLLEDGSRVDFAGGDEGMRILRILRDEAHELANITHRQSRDMGYYYELAGILPSLNEKQRQTLLVRLGSIKRILELKETDLPDLKNMPNMQGILRDLDNYRLGKSIKMHPLIVPIRFDDPNGDAEDLRPIKALR